MNSPRREEADRVTASQAYAQRFAGEVGAYFLAVQTARTLELMASWPGAKVLDVGGGHAQLAPPLIQAGYQVTVAGSDDSCAQRLARLLTPGSYNFVAADLMDLPWPEQSFDLVLSFRMLTHVADPPAYAAQLCRLAKRAVVVDYPAKRSFNLLADSLFKAKQSLDDNQHTRPFVSFWDSEVEALFAAQGFDRPARRRQHFWPMALHRALGSGGFTKTAEGLARGLGLTALLGSPVILRMERGA
ncbi:MAG: methyltransferase domain-containing protein [Proteobacteria bacterium]|nr:methyltransferase domain-containing protein [Pseudomonadota bacterium]MBU1450547.1 methyltransferase domain-containing protein [Pseudomonadota bacterium]MBU2468403.1 methyltransferase domain-containing protein [Pseudomonadota bacterium]MBU2519232.1 methyltransferase domain-containing protein [Pseudomonadota bacterium]